MSPTLVILRTFQYYLYIIYRESYFSKCAKEILFLVLLLSIYTHILKYYSYFLSLKNNNRYRNKNNGEIFTQGTTI